jgi:hypothetical protein
MTYDEVAKASVEIIAGFQEHGVEPIDAMGILVTALVLLRRTTNVQSDIAETAEVIRQAVIDTDKDIDDSNLAFEDIALKH